MADQIAVGFDGVLFAASVVRRTFGAMKSPPVDCAVTPVRVIAGSVASVIADLIELPPAMP